LGAVKKRLTTGETPPRPDAGGEKNPRKAKGRGAGYGTIRKEFKGGGRGENRQRKCMVEEKEKPSSLLGEKCDYYFF